VSGVRLKGRGRGDHEQLYAQVAQRREIRIKKPGQALLKQQQERRWQLAEESAVYGVNDETLSGLAPDT